MTAAKKPVTMCCVTIGYQSYLLPSDKGMKLVELMQSAFTTQNSYGERGYVYHVGEQPEVALTLVKPAQIKPPQIKPRNPNTNAAGQRLLGMED